MLFFLFLSVASPILVTLKDGRKLSITTVKQLPVTSNLPDGLNYYAQRVLELGLCYKNFIECIKVPNRNRMLRTLKVVLMLLKADSFKCKYGDEILRFLVQQCYRLSMQEAHFMFYSMFVNTSGRSDGNIPADLQMEFLVKVYKKHINQMMSNKRDANVTNRVNALAGLNEIIHNFDAITVHSVRTKKHSTPLKTDDELAILSDLRKTRPFKLVSARHVEGFNNIEASLLALIDSTKYIQWLNRRSSEHAKSLSN